MTTPLTHHDIIREAASLTRHGLNVNVDKSDRASRLIVFHVRQITSESSLHECYTLAVLVDGGVELCRAVGNDSGLIATLTARADSLDTLIDVFFDMPIERLLVQGEQQALALSYTLEPIGVEASGARLQLQQLVGRCGRLELRSDVSATFGMPADTLLMDIGDSASRRGKRLASGVAVPEATLAARTLSDALPRTSSLTHASGPSSKRRDALKKQDLPDDVLALLGPQWRPLVWQGGYWKTVLRQLGTEPQRSIQARKFGIAALQHLAEVRQSGPAHYHQQYAADRARAWFRRLRPVMLLLAIMSTAPAFWAATTFTGFRLHPMAMGLTPLLLMGVVMMTSREFPIMELPAFPRTLNVNRWALSPSDEDKAGASTRADSTNAS